MNRSVVTSPGVPADRVKVMRAAFESMEKDPKYKAEIERVTGFEPVTFSGEEAEDILKGFVKSVTPDVLAYMRSIMK